MNRRPVQPKNAVSKPEPKPAVSALIFACGIIGAALILFASIAYLHA
jgi:threonine dehydrogenase-like Zn-dependent dehydrogenase